MGNSRRLFGDLVERIWGSCDVKWRLFGDLREWTWGSGLLGASFKAVWSVNWPSDPLHMVMVPTKSHSCGHGFCLGWLGSLKSLTVVHGKFSHILFIQRISIH